MNKFELPEIELIQLEVEDVLTASSTIPTSSSSEIETSVNPCSTETPGDEFD